MKFSISVMLVFFGTFFCGCHQQNPKTEIEFFNGVHFDLTKDESIVPINKLLNAHYKSLFIDSTINMPLYKVIHNNEYTIYIAIPFKFPLRKINANNLIKSDTIIPTNISSLDTSNTCYRSYQKKDTSIIEYACNIQSSLFYLVGTTTSPKVAQQMFNYQSLSKRFQH